MCTIGSKYKIQGTEVYIPSRSGGLARQLSIEDQRIYINVINKNTKQKKH